MKSRLIGAAKLSRDGIPWHRLASSLATFTTVDLKTFWIVIAWNKGRRAPSAVYIALSFLKKFLSCSVCGRCSRSTLEIMPADQESTPGSREGVLRDASVPVRFSVYHRNAVIHATGYLYSFGYCRNRIPLPMHCAEFES